MIEILTRYVGILASRREAAQAGQHSTTPRLARQRRRRGLTAIEYCFMLSLVMLAVLFAVQHLGNMLKTSFESSDTYLSTYLPVE